MNPNSPKKERKFRYYLTVELPEDFSDTDADHAQSVLKEFCNNDLAFYAHRIPIKVSKVSYITSANN